MKKVIIIGGGASGIMAAITAARHADVTIIEHKDRIGKKILMTGNGKCNLTNLSFSNLHYYTDTPDFLDKIWEQFSVADTISFFHGIGMLTKEKKGYLYPQSEQASTVLDILRIELERLHVKVITECEVEEILPNQGFTVKTNHGTFHSDALILACGSKAAPQTGSDGSGYELARKLGHRVLEPLPALVQLRCKENYMKSVAGVRWESKIHLYVDKQLIREEYGELQLTDYGISGIPVFQLSRIAAKALHRRQRVQAQIDLLPSMEEKEIVDYLTMRIRTNPSLSGEEALIGLMNKKLALMILKLNQVKAGDSLQTCYQKDPGIMEKIAITMKNWSLTIEATNPFQNAQVCCGGVSCKELTEHMESKIVKNLFFAGELVDVDGICGGYNLQWAWSSGYVAGSYSGK